MFVKELRLQQFRNYGDETVVFHPKVNIIAGKNAQGKTNLLEAISIMSMGKSFRTRKDSEMIGFGKEFCRASCVYLHGDRERSIEIEIRKDGKKAKVDGVPAEKNIDLLENIYIVVFSPDDLKIVKEEPEKRRKFIDRELCQIKPVYYRNLARYKKVLLQRNNLLKSERCSRSAVEAWNHLLAEYGAKIMMERDGFLKKINQISSRLHADITAGREKLELGYESDLPRREIFEDQRDVFLKILADSFEKDIQKGNTGKGPHKDDIRISVNGIDVRHFGSQGQQRTAALSMKLAEISLIKQETGEEAILLLDDVLSELDGERQKFLTHSLNDVQLFITTAELNSELLETLPEHKIYWVERGKISGK